MGEAVVPTSTKGMDNICETEINYKRGVTFYRRSTLSMKVFSAAKGGYDGIKDII